ncbi:MAG: hypothetical protein A3F47_02050 [Candidatus Staskawiczbacteria bacterium RIFCSPHIGHO2_12_FULL_38_11]|uniref:Uncharacterized protein n=1 Tax=Candidatus Staskawiczbacteria bacterium RIFCSPHIGHO2_12_FULL_38_11 TaxID=1802209 RepID=A0A1G2I3I8_9BACT|nr:MAG: hypothetical protein A3F47_02050 [Candidatus Staskawiczbacteria bacterium RIFCSPHIGHO2_12_FULL_38_11]
MGMCCSSPKTRRTKGTKNLLANAVNKQETGDFYGGLFEETSFPLCKYTLPSGRVYREEVQAYSCHEGVVFFLALKDERGSWVPESVWEVIVNDPLSEEDMEQVEYEVAARGV